MTLATYYGGAFASYDTNPPEANVDMLNAAKAEAAWNGAVEVLHDAITRIPRLETSVAALYSEGRWSGRLDASLASYVTDTQKLLTNLVKIFEASPGAQAALDAQIAALAGAQTVTQGAWREFVADLKPPPQQTGLGFWTVAYQGLARVFGNPAVWAGAREILRKLSPWVGPTIISWNVSEGLNAESKTLKERGANLESCLEKLRTAESDVERNTVEKLCAGVNAPPTSSNTWGWLAIGVVAGVGGLIYWQNRHRFTVQSPVKLAGLSGVSRRRRYG